MHIPTQSITLNHKGNEYSLVYKLRSSTANKGTLVFLTGVGCIKECFDEAFEADELKDYIILTLDFLGFGESDKPSDFSYALEEQAAIVKLLLEALHLEHLVIIGHSMGAGIGLLLAQGLPIDNFLSVEGAMVSGDISGLGPVTKSEKEFITSGYDALRKSLLASGRKDFTTWAHWLETADKKALFRGMWSTADWAGSSKLLQYFNDLPKKSYMYGDERSKDYLLPRLVGATIYRMEHCGHFMMIDDPDAFYGSVVKALALK